MWLDRQVSLYTTHSDNFGRPATFREILFNEFASDLHTITKLKQLDRTAVNYKEIKTKLKSTLQCYAPAALLATKAKGKLGVIKRSGIMQLDFDFKDIKEYDIEELKLCIFQLPFIGFCSLSCSGDGIYALVLIAEPEKLSEYAEHCFKVLLDYGIKADTTKGKHVGDLRYLGYDANMLIRENPEELLIKNFKNAPLTSKPKIVSNYQKQKFNQRRLIKNDLRLDRIIQKQLYKITTVVEGERHLTIGKVGKVLGGYQHLTNIDLLSLLQNEIANNKILDDKAMKFSKAAFEHGRLSPIKF